jgi:nicotinamide-nucleotide amidase
MTAGEPDPLAVQIVARLRAAHQTVATAESLTAGAIAVALTTVPGASKAVRGGLIVYATDLKTSLAGVDADVLRAGGAVQATVARQLAAGAQQRCGSDWGIGITGVAGPDPQDGRPVGQVFCAVVGPECLMESSVQHPSSGDSPTSRRAMIRAAACQQALLLLHGALTEATDDEPHNAAATSEHRGPAAKR